ncbi:unnamed protein product [Arabidopsis halleri]
MSDTFFWNVRGINEVTKHRTLANWINSKPVTFGALLETHVKEPNLNHILSSIGPGWSVINNYQHSELGKIWIIFKLPTTVRFLFSDLQSISVEVTLETGFSFVYTAVYASNDLEERRVLWQSLRDTHTAFGLSSLPWLVNGDFNEILHPSETSNHSIIRSTCAMREFGECLADIGLFDLPFHGPCFTWSNHQQDDPIGKKLDRCLVNGNWIHVFPTSHCSFEAPEFSDHSPCHINIFTKPPDFGSRPFKFFNLLTKHPSFLDTVQAAWDDSGEKVSTLRDFGYKLKQLKRPLKSLCKENYSEIEKRVFEASNMLKSLQMAALSDPSFTNLLLEKSARENWVLLRLAEESFFKQRSRIKWLAEGDFNTSFFHFIMKLRNGGNAVKYLLRPDGSRAESTKDIHVHAVEFFADLLGSIRGQFYPDLHEFLELLNMPSCSQVHQALLLAPVTSEIIKEALSGMPSSKTPGPDGFTAEFFKAAWGIAASEGSFKYHPGCEELELTHLSFADDLLIFLDGVDDTVLQQIHSSFALSPGTLPIRYLGLPLCSRKLSVADFDPLLSQIRKKVQSWSHRHLSLAGRYTLISSVISGIIGFWSSAFMLPKQVIRRINTICSA